MTKLILTVAILGVLALNYLVQSQSTAWLPQPRNEDWWIEGHANLVNISRYNSSAVKIMFTGSSFIEHWSTTGKELFNSKYVPLGSVNYGLGGDQTQHLIYRIMNGELDYISPNLAIVYIGTNNLPHNYTNAQILQGITTVLAEFVVRLPKTKILYLNINARADIKPVTDTWDRIKLINAETSKFHDGKRIYVFDMFDNFAASWGQLKDWFYENDNLHLNKDGYDEWDRFWNTTFFEVLQATGPTMLPIPKHV